MIPASVREPASLLRRNGARPLKFHDALVVIPEEPAENFVGVLTNGRSGGANSGRCPGEEDVGGLDEGRAMERVRRLDEVSAMIQLRVLDIRPVVDHRRRGDPLADKCRFHFAGGTRRRPRLDHFVDLVFVPPSSVGGAEVRVVAIDGGAQPAPVIVVPARDGDPVVFARGAIHAMGNHLWSAAPYWLRA